jgi:hypothetical protein
LLEAMMDIYQISMFLDGMVIRKHAGIAAAKKTRACGFLDTLW